MPRFSMPGFSISRFYILLCSMALVACGFQLRNTADLQFHTIYIQGAKLSITKNLKKALEINDVKVVSNPEKAELLLDLMSEKAEQRILSLSGSGLVREFELLYRVNFRMRDQSSELWGPMQHVDGRRDFSYDDSQLLAKQFEQDRLNQDMRDDAVREILRRLIVQKPKPKPAE